MLNHTYSRTRLLANLSNRALFPPPLITPSSLGWISRPASADKIAAIVRPAVTLPQCGKPIRGNPEKACEPRVLFRSRSVTQDFAVIRDHRLNVLLPVCKDCQPRSLCICSGENAQLVERIAGYENRDG